MRLPNASGLGASLATVELATVIGSYTPLTRKGQEWEGVCPLETHAEPLAVIGERFKCYGCGAEGDALEFLRLVGEPDPEHALTNGRAWHPTLTAPTPPPSKYSIERIADKPLTGRALIVDSRKAAKIAEVLLAGQFTALAVWPDGGDRWGALEPLRGRAVLLWPGPDTTAAFERLEAVLTDPAGLAVTGKLVQGIDLVTWAGSRDELVAAAKQAVRNLTISAAQNPAVQVSVAAFASQTDGNVANGAPPPSAPSPPAPLDPIGTPQTSAEQPPQDTDFPANASTAPPRRRRLRVAGGTDIDAPDPDADPLPASMSEDMLADHFAMQHSKDWRYVRAWNQWLEWDGSGWRRDETGKIDRLAVLLTRQAVNWPEGRALTPKERRQVNKRSTAGAARDIAANDRSIAATVEQWDTDPMLLGCPGGAIDLRTGKLIEGERDAYITLRTAVAPERGEPTLWLSHLEKSLKGDTDTIAFLRRYLGYMLTGDVGEHCLVFFYGTGRNGKGTIVETIIKLLGDYGYAAPMNLLMESKNERHPTELAALRARRAVSASEPPEGARWDDGRIRWLTGGDTITARGMRQDLFSFSPTHKLLLMGNHTPSLRSVDEAIQARFRIIEFSYFFPPEERDTHFADKLREEWPRILQWMIDGCLEWQDAGLGLPERIEQATSEYLQSEDEFADWILDCVDVAPQASARSGDAYQNFKAWAEKRGSYVPSQKSFSRKLKDRGFASVRTSDARWFKGFSLKLGANL